MQIKNSFPVWRYYVIDLLFVAIFCTSFYFLYYKLPRDLVSENIVIINPEEQSENSESVDSDCNTDGDSDLTDWQIKFKDKFSDKIISTKNTYKSPNISIRISKQTKGSGKSLITYYLGDIYISKIECFATGLARDKYGVGYSENLLDMDKRLNARIAINGDYYGIGNRGVCIRNGVAYRTKADTADICVLYYDGTMKTYTAGEFDFEEAVDNGAYQAWNFGPALLDKNGNKLDEFPSSRVTPKNPRTAIGYFEPGHYCFVLVDGRSPGYSTGMTMPELSSLMRELGCNAAYNLDGGQSSTLTFNDRVINQPYNGGRPCSDCIIIKEADGD